MKYLAAYALCALNGAPTKDQVKAVLKAAKVEVDAKRVDEVFAQFEGKKFEDLVATGKAKIGSAGPAAGGAAAAPAAKGAAPAAKKEEVKEEEGDDDMGFGLFD